MNSARTRSTIALLCTALAVSACGANSGDTATTGTGENFPDGPVTLVIPSSAGAPIDSMARTLSVELEEELGVPVVVSNRPGGSGIVAMSYTQQQPADGQTVTMEATGITSVLQLDSAPFSWEAFEPVSRIELDPFALFVDADSPYQTLEEFLAAAESEPGQLSVAGYGTGSPHHITAQRLADASGVEYQWVAYPSGSDAITALLGGNTDAVLSNASQITRFGDEVRTLAHSSEEPLPNAPDVPSFSEQGYDQLTGYHWRGALVRDETPQPIVEELNDAFSAAVASDSFQSYLDEVGNLDGTMPRDEFAQLLEEQAAADAEVLESLGIIE